MTPRSEQIFHVSQTQGESMVQPHRVTDDFRRKAGPADTLDAMKLLPATVAQVVAEYAIQYRPSRSMVLPVQMRRSSHAPNGHVDSVGLFIDEVPGIADLVAFVCEHVCLLQRWRMSVGPNL